MGQKSKLTTSSGWGPDLWRGRGSVGSDTHRRRRGDERGPGAAVSVVDAHPEAPAAVDTADVDAADAEVVHLVEVVESVVAAVLTGHAALDEKVEPKVEVVALLFLGAPATPLVQGKTGTKESR